MRTDNSSMLSNALKLSEFNQEMLNETGSIAKIGGWQMDLVNNKVTWTKETYILHEVDDDFQPDLNSAINFYAPDSRPIITKAVNEAISEGKGFDLELELITMKGRHFWANAIGKAVKKDGKIVAVQGIFQDITERRIVQQKILEQKAELENLLLERDKLFSIIAHDLRSPFMGFISLTELLADEGSQVAAAMNDSAKKILHLLDELLEWSLLLRKGKEAVPGKINLRNQSEISRQLYIKNLSGKSIRFENRIPDELFVFAESKVLDIILRNLFSNAIKFTGPNGLIVLDARLEGSMVTVSVSDSGIGIPSDIAGELFSFSAKTKRDGTEGEKSMGLGLMLCKDYVEKIGGRIWFESKENVGTSFYFTVPAPEK